MQQAAFFGNMGCAGSMGSMGSVAAGQHCNSAARQQGNRAARQQGRMGRVGRARRRAAMPPTATPLATATAASTPATTATAGATTTLFKPFNIFKFICTRLPSAIDVSLSGSLVQTFIRLRCV